MKKPKKTLDLVNYDLGAHWVHYELVSSGILDFRSRYYAINEYYKKHNLPYLKLIIPKNKKSK